MLSGRRHRWIGKTRNNAIDIGPAREVAILGIVIRLLHILDARRNRDRAAQMISKSRHALEVGKGVQRQIHFAGRAAILVTIYFF